MLYTTSLNHVLPACAQARAFNCRSLSQKDDRCYLSGDDSLTLIDVALPSEPGEPLT
jgi:hypothetical protein